jgi:enoyl-CoA hydratase/carnithine racemase
LPAATREVDRLAAAMDNRSTWKGAAPNLATAVNYHRHMARSAIGPLPAEAQPVVQPLVEVRWHEPYATVTMNVPERRNALSLEHMRALIAAFREVGESRARGVVLAGNGPVFCSGHDFADLVGADLDAMTELLQTCTELMTMMQSIGQPVLARVHGPAIAGGCQLMASTDLAVAAESATFSTPGGKGGWFCHTPMVAVGRAIGRKRALQMALTGDPIDARTALAWGLVNVVVPADELDAACLDLLERATRGTRASKALGKRTFYAQIDLDQERAYDHALEVMASSSQTAGARESFRAFLEKRPADFGDE